MPYELVVARHLPGESWARTLERIEESADMVPRPLSEQRAASWARAADRINRPGRDRVRTGVNRLELHTTAPAVHVVLEENAAFVAVPYWHGAGDATSAMVRVADIVRVLCEETGWPAWDTQLGREPTIPDDLTGEGAEILAAAATSTTTAETEQRSRWSFRRR